MALRSQEISMPIPVSCLKIRPDHVLYSHHFCLCYFQNAVRRDCKTLRDIIKFLNNEFSYLTKTVQTLIKDKNVREIKSAFTSGPRYCNKFLLKWCNAVNGNESHQPGKPFSFFKAEIWNFLNYYFLHQLINAFGDPALKSSMEAFVSNVEGFKEMTLVEDFGKCWAGQNASVPGYVKLEVKFGIRDLTMQEIEIFCEELRLNFFSSLFTNSASCMFYHGFGEEGSVVSWLIPSELAEILKSNVQINKSLFADFEVIHAELEEYEGIVSNTLYAGTLF